jgi:hypothetical protein
LSSAVAEIHLRAQQVSLSKVLGVCETGCVKGLVVQRGHLLNKL